MKQAGQAIKTYKKIGSCKKKHSVNVVEAHMKGFLSQFCDTKEELAECLAEQMADAMTDGQAACEAVGCEA
jgi:uncharacterized protein YbjQ (UPF0145 family)